MLVTQNELGNIREDLPDSSIALRLGCYDLLHSGHQAGIDYAAAQANVLFVGVMPDTYVSRTKGPNRPVNNEVYRAEAIDQAEGVNYTFIVQPGKLSVVSLFRRLRPNVYVEDEEHGARQMKTLFLRTLGIEYDIDYASRIGSTSQMISQLGLPEAMARSNLSYSMQLQRTI